uniref:Uncharacterized protein n=1 Tax=uncultured marine virus TaxID=186617 RepID=A0A0F7L877_9VIRU|nr:hypothetical protein [uncultured marine virus]
MLCSQLLKSLTRTIFLVMDALLFFAHRNTTNLLQEVVVQLLSILLLLIKM